MFPSSRTATTDDEMSVTGMGRQLAGKRAPRDSPEVPAVGPCPDWCERPPEHQWDDGFESGDLMRFHRRTLPIPGTLRGSVMVTAAEYRGPGGVVRDPVSFVVDTGVGDCELNAAGARGLLRVLNEALDVAGVLRSPNLNFFGEQ